MMMFHSFVIACTVVMAWADISSDDPPLNTCLCLTGNNVNVRDAASLSSNKLGKASIGECYRYIGNKITNDGYTWFNVDYQGTDAWIAGSFLETAVESQCDAAPPLNTCLCLTGNGVNVRDAAGLSSNTIGSASNGECYRYNGYKTTNDGYTWFNVDYQGTGGWIAGNYLQTGAGSQCNVGGCTTGTVDYRGYTVSNSNVRNKLQEIANLFCTRLWVTSGDRNWGGNSLHDVHRAADWWLDPYDNGATVDGEKIYTKLWNSGILDIDYEVIYHGIHTSTGGMHMHTGYYGDGRPSCFKREGTTPANSGIYEKVCKTL